MKIINKQILDSINNGSLINLNIGSGNDRINGYYNLDIIESPNVDIVADLNQKLSLIPDNSVLRVYSRASLEHIHNLTGLLKEISRICIDGADIFIAVPHFSNPYYYSDPTHVRFFGIYTFNYFAEEKNQIGRHVPRYEKDLNFKINEVTLDFYREKLADKIIGRFMKFFVNINLSSLEFYERRLCYIFPAWQICYRLTNIKTKST